MNTARIRADLLSGPTLEAYQPLPQAVGVARERRAYSLLFGLIGTATVLGAMALGYLS